MSYAARLSLLAGRLQGRLQPSDGPMKMFSYMWPLSHQSPPQVHSTSTNWVHMQSFKA